MDVDKIKFTSSASKALDSLKAFVESQNHNVARSAHAFCVCFAFANEGFHEFLVEKGLDFSSSKLERVLEKYAIANPNLFLSDTVPYRLCESINSLIRTAFEIAKDNDHDYVGIEHLIAAFLKIDNQFCDFLASEGIDMELLKLSVNVLVVGDDLGIDYDGDFDDEDDDDDDDYRPSKNLQPIQKFCSLLNDTVSAEGFPKISGREREIDLMEEILGRKTKSNCVLIGEAGTGKTTIVEGLAQRICSPEYTGPLKGKKVYSLDMGALVAGTKYRGQFEERFSQLLKELQKDADSVLFIDEIHSIIGTGGREGQQDAANMLKPALARGDLKCIGATTSTEYKKYFEKDAALARRFHTVPVEEPKVDLVLEMAMSAMPSYEEHHKVSLSPEVIELAVQMCQTYLPNQRFPDKLFDVLDQTSSRARIQFERTAQPENVEDVCVVTADDICAVIADKINVGIETIKASCSATFSLFKEKINDVVFGQSENVSRVYDLLACAKSGFQSEDKPIASFFFVGPTSVGKTFLAKNMAKEFYGNDSSYLRLDMSEYQEQGSISRLIGTSAGYVGYEDGGLLTEFVRKNPNSLVLFDEVEKCNRSVLNLLLQILEEAKLTDNLGRSVDFSRCIIVMTSNVGAGENKASMGFVPSGVTDQESYKQSVIKMLSPELLSRIDDVVIFDDLDKESIKKIFLGRVDRISGILQKKGVELELESGVEDFINFAAKEHARDVKKIVRQKIEIPVAKYLVGNPEKKKITVKILDGNTNVW